MRNFFRSTQMGVALLLLSGVSWSQPLPAKAGEIVYLAGGIGGDEVAAMRVQAKDFNVRIEFVELEEGSQHGNWTADASVDVLARGQEKVHIDVPGPLLMMRLPAGAYSIEATRNGERLRMELTVADARSPVSRRFVWRVPKGSLGNGLRVE